MSGPELTIEQRTQRIHGNAYPAYCNERMPNGSTKARRANDSREEVFRAGIKAALASLQAPCVGKEGGLREQVVRIIAAISTKALALLSAREHGGESGA